MDGGFGARFPGAGPGRNEIKLVGNKATLRVDVAKSGLFLSGENGSEQPLVVPQEERRGWQVEADFVNSIRTGEPVKLTSFNDGLRYMEFTEAVFQRISNLSC